MPNTPLYPQSQTVPPGQTAPTLRPWTNFLPTDPNAVSTGLTPQMMQSIGAIPQPTPQTAAPAGGGGGSYSQMLDFFRQMMGGGGGGGGGMGGGGLPPAGDPGLRARAAQVRLNSNYQSPAAGGMGGGGGQQFFPIPRPTPGAGGLISPADMTAYTAATQQQQQQRDRLANEMNRSVMRNRYDPGMRGGGGGGRGSHD